ncbi:mycofactocin biosynthesis peptidyl-dipeptidase MftE [Mycobacterium uberis]|uniref:Mycofactocin biosynthesis peptidyl-dipeptidase MftE n=1 Tax=Mycobacterium uberis TaxID=2162698 RepID=A0A3E1HIE5_9MYCO|nr:mycofactocin biosynthesis peptidyl-dipeptidase MftE [Mycobacterium uberis]RFD26231.1 mycofactocin biosynthesis peptidyl-dipeptidase MftE [Mycobacterium uberis]
MEGSTIGTCQENSSYHRQVPVLGELASVTSSQLAGISPSIMIPLGSTEQHGPHLPLDTDTRIATAVARRAQACLMTRVDQDWLVAPALAYGASGEHQSFSGTISIGTEVLTALLVEYGRSASCWAQRLVFINGHGGNVDALDRAVSELRAEGCDVAWCPCTVAGGDAHAGHTETSVLLHISPADVQTDRWFAGNGAPLAELLPSMRSGGVAAVSMVGVLGDPTTATADEGRRIFAEMVDRCVRRIACWLPRSDGMLT